MNMAKIKIDGIELEVADRTPLLQAAEKAGVKIPTLCHHPLVEAYGVCRICTVEVHLRNRVRMVTACNYPVSNGIEVFTRSERVLRSRRMILEWMLARCGNVPVINALAEEYGATGRFGRGDDDCILCGLCVKVCSDVVGAHVLGFFDRGPHRTVSTAYDRTSEQCIACGACASVCPTGAIKIKDDQEGIYAAMPMGPLTSIHIDFMQAVPRKAVIDRDSCIHFKTGKCQVCVDVCEARAIDHAQQDRVEEVEVGSILLTTGFQLQDPRGLKEYGYGKYKNVMTSLDFEVLNNAGGPTGGKILTADGKVPKSIGIVHCVGSRDQKYHEYCSRVCCMYALKFAHLIKEKIHDCEVYNFYIDMRCFGKGYEEFYNRLLKEGVNFVRGKVAEINDAALDPSEEGRLVMRAEDTMIGVVRRIPVDLVVLCLAIEAKPEARELSHLFTCSTGKDGFFTEKHPKLAPVSTAADGIFIAGACQGPKDIPDTVAQAGAAASAALSLIQRGEVETEAVTAEIVEELCSGCQICVGLCPYTAIAYDKEKNRSVINEALCKGCGTCVAACPSAAAFQKHFRDEQIFAEIEGILAV
jgi:heterodisulfide reductase subunit A